MRLIIIFLFIIFVYAYIKGVNAYDAFLEGAKQGSMLVIKIIPNLCACLLLVSLLKISKLFILLSYQHLVDPKLLFMFLIKPFSNQSALEMLFVIYEQFNPNSVFGIKTSLIYLCSDSFIYVLTIYYGSINQKVPSLCYIVCFVTYLIVSVIILLFF